MRCLGESREPREAGTAEPMALSVSSSGNDSSFQSMSRLDVTSEWGKEKVEPHLEPCPYPFLS